MQWGGSIIAILGWLGLGLALTAVAWLFFWRWTREMRAYDELDRLNELERLGGSAADRKYRFGGDGSQGATDRRKVRTGHVRTHDQKAGS